MDIDGSAALVTGGASGLGEATVRALHSRGARVTIADVNEEKGKALAEDLGLEFVSCDVREEEQVQAAVERAASAEGGLRIAVACAGTGWAQKVAGSKGPHPLMPFEIIISINLIGTFNLLRLASSAMIANEPGEDGERGVCIHTASIAAFDGQVGQIAYSASKGGVVGMTLPAARDLSQYGIRVNTIAPGLFDTPLLAALPEEARQKLGAGAPSLERGRAREAEHHRLAAEAAVVAERVEPADILHAEPDARGRPGIELAGAREHGKALPLSLLFAGVAEADVGIEDAAGCQRAGDEGQAFLDDVVVHVEQHGERPGDVDGVLELHLGGALGVDQQRALVLQPGLGQLLARLLQHLRARLDAGVVAGLQVVDQRDAAAQRAAADVEQARSSFQPVRGQELELEAALHLPAVGRADERVPPGGTASEQKATPACSSERPPDHAGHPGGLRARAIA
jgi:NAD(P)-dependent dehydrogenase (short-subunit alcohol dehydrogenase family)